MNLPNLFIIFIIFVLFKKLDVTFFANLFSILAVDCPSGHGFLILIKKSEGNLER